MIQEELNRFDRTLAILILLQSKKLVKASQLSDRFGVSLRTIYRDIRSLEAAGVPILGEAGVGYSIMEGYRLPPVMFTREEAGSFVAAEMLMRKFTNAALGGHFESAMGKVKSVLKGQEKDWIEVLEKSVWAAPSHDLFNKKIPNALELLFNSIATQNQVYLEYQAVGKAETSFRAVEPVGVFHENAHWYLYAFCHLRKAYRQFRTDRIRTIKATDISFVGKHENISSTIQDNCTTDKTKVVIAVEKGVMNYIRDSKKYYGFVNETETEKEIVMEFQVAGTIDGLARWYLMFGDNARVVAPNSFKEKIKELTTKTMSQLTL